MLGYAVSTRMRKLLEISLALLSTVTKQEKSTPISILTELKSFHPLLKKIGISITLSITNTTGSFSMSPVCFILHTGIKKNGPLNIHD